MDIVNYSQCRPLDPKNNRKTLLASPIGASNTSSPTVRRMPATATVTSRDYYQQQPRPSDPYTASTLEANYLSNTHDYSAANSIKNNNNTKTSDSYEYESKMYQEMSSFYHHPSQHHRTCAGYNMPPTAYEMRSFGPMSTAMTAPNVQASQTPPPPPPPPPSQPPSASQPMPMQMYPQRPHHETRVHQPSPMRPHTELNYSNAAAASTSSADAWYQAPSAADQMINMLYMNNR